MGPYDIITSMLLNLRKGILYAQMCGDRRFSSALSGICSGIAEDITDNLQPTEGDTKAGKIAFIGYELADTAGHSAMGVSWKRPLMYEEYIIVYLNKEPVDHPSRLQVEAFLEGVHPLTLEMVLNSMRHDPFIELGHSYQAKALPLLTDVTIMDTLLEDVKQRDNFVFAHFHEVCRAFGPPAFPYVRKALMLPDEVIKHERLYVLAPFVETEVLDLLVERLPHVPDAHLKVMARLVTRLEESGVDINVLVPILRERQSQLLSTGLHHHLSLRGWAFYAITTALAERSSKEALAKYEQMVENRDFLNPALVWLT